MISGHYIPMNTMMAPANRIQALRQAPQTVVTDIGRPRRGHCPALILNPCNGVVRVRWCWFVDPQRSAENAEPDLPAVTHQVS